MSLPPEDPQLHHFLGVLYELSGDQERAVERYEEAIRFGPDLGEAKNNLAYIYAESGTKLDRALDLQLRDHGVLARQYLRRSFETFQRKASRSAASPQMQQ